MTKSLLTRDQKIIIANCKILLKASESSISNVKFQAQLEEHLEVFLNLRFAHLYKRSGLLTSALWLFVREVENTLQYNQKRDRIERRLRDIILKLSVRCAPDSIDKVNKRQQLWPLSADNYRAIQTLMYFEEMIMRAHWEFPEDDFATSKSRPMVHNRTILRDIA
jgi:hypothetical protein